MQIPRLLNLFQFIVILLILNSCTCIKHNTNNDSKMDKNNLESTQQPAFDMSNISDYKGSYMPDSLCSLLPVIFANYTSKKPSKSIIFEGDYLITIAKGEYSLLEKNYISVDVIDYSPAKLVLKPERFNNPPAIENNDVKPYIFKNGRGYLAWNSVKNSGWLDVLINNRFNIKIRVWGPITTEQTMIDFLNSINIEKLQG